MKKLLVVPFLIAPFAAFAAVPADVTTALTAAGTDGIAVASAVLIVIVGIAAFKYMRRAL